MSVKIGSVACSHPDIVALLRVADPRSGEVYVAAAGVFNVSAKLCFTPLAWWFTSLEGWPNRLR